MTSLFFLQANLGPDTVIKSVQSPAPLHVFFLVGYEGFLAG